MASSGSEWPRVGYDCWNTFDYVYHITCIISILLANAYTDICLLCFVTKKYLFEGTNERTCTGKCCHDLRKSDVKNLLCYNFNFPRISTELVLWLLAESSYSYGTI